MEKESDLVQLPKETNQDSQDRMIVDVGANKASQEAAAANVNVNINSNSALNISKKRGPKPRSKRNRKRARSARHELEEKVEHQMQILPLELDGSPIGEGMGMGIDGDDTGSSKKAITRYIRTVEPYPYTFSTYAKARWIGRTVIDIYTSEFGSYPKSYYETAILQGRILVSDQIVPLDYVIKGSDVLTHTVHRHEPGVAITLHQPPYVRIIKDTDDILAVEKPGTLPIHPCGGYHVQSLMTMLEPSYGKLYTIHRLDRLTGGLVILGKTPAIATEWGKAIMKRDCQKFYLVRVKGKFPLNCPTTLTHIQNESQIPDHGEYRKEERYVNTKPIATVPIETLRKQNAYGFWITDIEGTLRQTSTLEDVFRYQGTISSWLDESFKEPRNNLRWLNLACPNRIAQPKDGICEAGRFEDLDDDLYQKTVKPAETSFGLIQYHESSDSSLILCRPKTGRTHQIRLHLQHLGHPIANDPNYGGEIWFGNKSGREACRIAQARLDDIAESNQIAIGASGTDSRSTATIDIPATEQEIEHSVSAVSRGEQEDIHTFIKRTCVWCIRSQNTKGETPRDVLEFLVRSPGIWLHAFQYTFKDERGLHSFRSPIPEWANLE